MTRTHLNCILQVGTMNRVRDVPGQNNSKKKFLFTFLRKVLVNMKPKICYPRDWDSKAKSPGSDTHKLSPSACSLETCPQTFLWVTSPEELIKRPVLTQQSQRVWDSPFLAGSYQCCGYTWSLGCWTLPGRWAQKALVQLQAPSPGHFWFY